MDDLQQKYRVSYGKFKQIAGEKRWNWNEHTEKKMKRSDGGHITIGDKYKRPGHGSRHVVIWNGDPAVAEPIVKEWLESQLGAGARIEQAAEGAASVGRFVGDLPKLLSQAERTADSFVAMAEDGLRLDDESVARLANAQAAQDRWTRLGIWVGAAALVVIALSVIF